MDDYGQLCPLCKLGWRVIPRERISSMPEVGRYTVWNCDHCQRWALPLYSRVAGQNHRFRGSNDVLDPIRVEVMLEDQGHKCARCSVSISGLWFHIDHIIPKAHGGRNIIENVQLLCPPCNRRKHTSIEAKAA